MALILRGGAWPAATSIPVPALVQLVGSTINDNNGIVGNAYIFNLPNVTQAGNGVRLTLAYPYSASRTISIVDSTGDTWPAPALTTGTAVSGNMRVSEYFLPNASSGLHKLTVTFDALLKPFQYTMAEFTNVISVDGTQGTNSVASPNVSAGSYTPTTNNDANGGHLICNYAISNDTVGTLLANQASAMSATNSASLGHADNTGTIPSVSSFSVQAANGAINPGFSITQSTPTNFVCSSIALKVGKAGAAALAGIRVKRILHCTVENPVAGNNVILFPSDGNLLVASMAAGNNLNVVNSVTDSNSQTYTNPGVAGQSQVFYHQNATPSNALKLTLNLNGGETQFSIHLIDIVGAAASAFDTTAGFNGAAPASGTVFNDFPQITPTTSPGLTIAQCGLGTASQSAMAAGAPAGAVFDTVSYTQTGGVLFDLDRMDNADYFGHANYSSTATQHWNWVLNSASFGSTAFGTAVCFKGA